jgi:hypothetical protein
MTDVLPQSVKKYDRMDVRDGGGAMQVLIPWTWLGGNTVGLSPLPDGLPDHWQRRDELLRSTVQAEGMWANALSISIDQLTALDWRVTGDVPLRVRRSLEIVQRLPFIKTLKKLKHDFHTTNNGAFLEVIRASSARGSRVLGFDHLDSVQCQRTGDPERPVIYTDRYGKQHELRWWQVVCFSDMESPSVKANGTGWCSAARAYAYIRQLATIEAYVYEKVAGKRPLAIDLVNNLSSTALESGIATAKADSEASGAQAFMGVVIIPVTTNDKLDHVRIDLAGLPDGFNEKDQWSKALLAYAKALGLDPQDVQPLTGQALGTGAQSRTLDEKAKRADAFQQEFEEALRDSVIEPGTKFVFVRNDLADKLAQAMVSKAHTDDVVALVGAEIITPDEAKQVKVDLDELPEQFLTAPDATPATSFDNTDNPEGGDNAE